MLLSGSKTERTQEATKSILLTLYLGAAPEFLFGRSLGSAACLERRGGCVAAETAS